MQTMIDEILDTKGVTVAYGHPTPRMPAYDWSCVGYDNPAVFDPADDADLAEARSVCGTCEVQALCLTLGINRDEWGVWGGVLLEGGTPIEKVKTRGRPKKPSAA